MALSHEVYQLHHRKAGGLAVLAAALGHFRGQRPALVIKAHLREIAARAVALLDIAAIDRVSNTANGHAGFAPDGRGLNLNLLRAWRVLVDEHEDMQVWVEAIFLAPSDFKRLDVAHRAHGLFEESGRFVLAEAALIGIEQALEQVIELVLAAVLKGQGHEDGAAAHGLGNLYAGLDLNLFALGELAHADRAKPRIGTDLQACIEGLAVLVRIHRRHLTGGQRDAIALECPMRLAILAGWQQLEVVIDDGFAGVHERPALHGRGGGKHHRAVRLSLNPEDFASVLVDRLEAKGGEYRVITKGAGAGPAPVRAPSVRAGGSWAAHSLRRRPTPNRLLQGN